MKENAHVHSGWWEPATRWWGPLRGRAVLSMLLAAIGCTSSGDDEEAFVPPPEVEMPAACKGPEIALDDYAECRVVAQCARDMRCDYAFDSVAECLDRRRFEQSPGRLQEVARGGMAYDAEAAAACVHWMAEAACTSDQFSFACRLAFVGARSAGDACFRDAECGLGGTCAGCEPGQCCQGTCVLPGKVGDPCDVEAPCSLELECDRNSQTCVEAPEPCFSDAECGAGFGCSASGACFEAVAEGEACTVFQAPRLRAPFDYRDRSDCAPGLSCVDSICRRTDYVGAPCADYDHCWGGLQCVGESFDHLGTCQPRARVGEGCSEDILCVGSSRCDLSRRLCVPLSTRGEYCDYDWDCAGALRCWWDEHRCLPAKPAGASCTRGTEECEAGLQCGPDSTCVDRSCSHDREEAAPL